MEAYLSTQKVALISLNLSLGVHDCLPFLWSGYKVIPHYTYQISLEKDESQLLGEMSGDRRKNLTKAAEEGVEVVDAKGTKEIRELVQRTFEKRGKKSPRGLIDAIFSNFGPGQSSYCILSFQKGKPVSGVYVVYDKRTAYHLLGGYSDRAHHGAGAAAMFRAIVKARELGLRVFDFQGSTVPQIERYFRGFGGRLLPIFSINKAWFPIEMCLKLKHRKVF
jgi:lipid II:glycine glycyltransferase (peptidoglycan interpeptide bridge formation enzyme)